MTSDKEALHIKIVHFIIFTQMIGAELAEIFGFYKLYKCLDFEIYSCSLWFAKLGVIVVDRLLTKQTARQTRQTIWTDYILDPFGGEKYNARMNVWEFICKLTSENLPI